MLFRQRLHLGAQLRHLTLRYRKPCLCLRDTLLLECDAVLIFIDGQATSVDIEVLVLVLPLEVAFKSLKVFNVLLF